MWNRHRATPEFTSPWLLRFFEVSKDAPMNIRRASWSRMSLVTYWKLYVHEVTM